MKKKQTNNALIISLCLSSILSYQIAAYDGDATTQVNTSTLQFAGLRGIVKIRRDERGVPYIEASNEEDLYFAQGYVLAADRLWQMDLMRRTARGELSEIFGPETLSEDKRRRMFGYSRIVEELVGRLSPTVRAAIEAYARGVNAYISSIDKKSLPPEFKVLQYEPRPWRAADSLLIGKNFAESLSTTFQSDLMRAALADLPQERRDALLPIISPLDVVIVGSDKASGKVTSVNQAATAGFRYIATTMVEMLGEVLIDISVMHRSLGRIGLYAEDLAASNNWVVSGRNSMTGKPLLANDPHLVPSAPSVWYLVQLTAPDLHVAGATVPGVPGVIIGHNERIAWGITNVAADVQDLYLEKFDGVNSRHYLTPSGWREAEFRREKINVRKNRADSAVETVELDVTITRHGPIVLEQDGIRYALAWPALDLTTNEFEAYYFINKAHNWHEFCAALKGYTGSPLNFVYGDVDGHIGYWAAGRYPIRKRGDGSLPHDGSTDSGDWVGYIPFEATPHLYDPPSGIIVTANNRVVGRTYPYYITNEWVVPYRARRIYDLLTAKDKMDVDDFRAIQADTYSIPDATFVTEVLKLGRPLANASSEWRDIVAAFDGWDAIMNAESRTMPLSNAMRAAFRSRILAAALGPELGPKYSWSNAGTFFDHVITTLPREWLPAEFNSYEQLIRACYKDALESLTKRIGMDRSQWTWGQFLEVKFPHPLSRVPLVGGQFLIAPIPRNGGVPAINRGESVSMRYIADLSNWDNTRQNISLGQSGNPASPHWKDQLVNWRTVTPQVFPFNKNAVATATREMLVLTGTARIKKHRK
jgi:penicillin amidase